MTASVKRLNEQLATEIRLHQLCEAALAESEAKVRALEASMERADELLAAGAPDEDLGTVDAENWYDAVAEWLRAWRTSSTAETKGDDNVLG